MTFWLNILNNYVSASKNGVSKSRHLKAIARTGQRDTDRQAWSNALHTACQDSALVLADCALTRTGLRRWTELNFNGAWVTCSPGHLAGQFWQSVWWCTSVEVAVTVCTDRQLREQPVEGSTCFFLVNKTVNMCTVQAALLLSVVSWHAGDRMHSRVI